MKRVVIIIALALSAFTAYLSVLGMTSIFPAVQGYEIYIMTAILEAAKIATAVWLHQNWERVTGAMKYYLAGVTVVLAIITSMGVYSFLMNSHRQQMVQVENGSAKTSQLIEVDLTRLKAELEQVESRLSLTTEASKKKLEVAKKSKEADLVGSNEESKLRELGKEKSQLLADIAKLEKQLIESNNQAYNESSKIGSLSYLVSIFGKEDKSNNERALTIFVMLLVASLDPLALSLLMNAYSLENAPRPVNRKLKTKTALAKKTPNKLRKKVIKKTKIKTSKPKTRKVKTFTIPKQAKKIKGRNIPENTFSLPKRAIVKKRKR